MNTLPRYSDRSGHPRFSFQVLFAVILLAASTAAIAQQPQLSLADILIGLRSKKVTLDERNSILAEAVRQRGVTFSLSADIEKELRVTGASNVLIDAVRQRSVVAAVPKPTPVATPTPAPTPTPPDFEFYKTRADVSLNKGEYTLALADYDKAVSLKSDSPVAYLNRGRAHLNLKDFTRAGADFERSIELNPKDSTAFFNRGVLNEKLGKLEMAAVDFQKAVELNPANEEAKTRLKKVRDELAAKAAPPPQPEPVRVAVPVAVPESVNLGNLAENAVKLVKPVYSPIAQKASIGGKVVVEVLLDEKGNVTEAKAVSGHQFLRGPAEDAAKRSKFKPGTFNGLPIKATGTITYSFSLKSDE